MRKIDLANQIIELQTKGFNTGQFVRVANLKDLMRCNIKELNHIYYISNQIVNN